MLSFDLSTTDAGTAAFLTHFPADRIEVGLTMATGMIMHGTATTAQYADLAELYTSDEAYEPGTVVKIGGEHEVTQTTIEYCPEVFGIVSTNPAYLMNSELQGEFVTPVALTGRVPCKVIGKVQPGDILVSSAIAGYAIVDNNPTVGTVIGKALQAKDSTDKGTIEIVVGKV